MVVECRSGVAWGRSRGLDLTGGGMTSEGEDTVGVTDMFTVLIAMIFHGYVHMSNCTRKYVCLLYVSYITIKLGFF